MKAKKALTIKFKSLGEVEKELLDLPQKKVGYVQPKDVVLFESINGFRNFMTLQKLELLTLIATEKPKSVYELAQMVERAIAPVQKDCNILAKTGFIFFEKEKGGRKTMTPKLKFNYDKIVVQVPRHPYELSFKAAA
jgi:predicted transcriptional regulator